LGVLTLAKLECIQKFIQNTPFFFLPKSELKSILARKANEMTKALVVVNNISFFSFLSIFTFYLRKKSGRDKISARGPQIGANVHHTDEKLQE
jgi:hypothetical protein